MEQKQSTKTLEVISAVVFAIASVAIAWCAYQSAWWGSIQLFRAVEAMGKTREASMKTITAQQQRLVDVGMFMQYLNAVYQDNTKLADFYQKRFRPEMRVAVEAWLATNPLENPKAPLHPFVMPEYSQAAEAEAQQLADQAEKILGKARETNRTLINYVFFNRAPGFYPLAGRHGRTFPAGPSEDIHAHCGNGDFSDGHGLSGDLSRGQVAGACSRPGGRRVNVNNVVEHERKEQTRNR